MKLNFSSVRKSVFLSFLLMSSIGNLKAQVAEEAQSVVGKIICGYQGWFNCYGDGSPVERWAHWSAGQYRSNTGLPAPGHLSIEMYPDISEYKAGSLFQTGFANLGDGSPAKLFSSYKTDVIDKHVEWMQKYGIDGVGLQRFLGETNDLVFKRNRDSISVRLKVAAEKYHRIFYIMYDMSANDADVTHIKTDWVSLENLKITESSNYAHQNGKPVVCLWGFGFTDRANKPANSLAIINWFKDKGYYVIGGVPTSWRTGNGDSWPGYTDVYKAFNMISPWSVGRFSNNSGADSFKTGKLSPDLTYCNANGIDYQPVIFSGFSWSNWKAGSENKINEIPRNKGEFFWRQFYNVKSLNIESAYIAMFDEYDESTSIMKAADSYFAIPGDQYFLTTSADGTYLSSDFYLRLAGKATRILKGIDPLTLNVSIPYSEGPIWFRTSLEKGFDAAVPTSNSVVASENIELSLSTPQCTVITGEKAHTGSYAIKFSATNKVDNNASCDFNIFDVTIPVKSDTELRFWTCPTNENGRYATIDLLMTDGTRLKNLNATDNQGILMRPSTAKGTINEWTETICQIGQWLAGKTIDKIYISFEDAPVAGTFSGYIDDVTIVDVNDLPSGIEDKNIQIGKSDLIDVSNNGSNGNLVINTSRMVDTEMLDLTIVNMQGLILFKKEIPAGTIQELFVNFLPRGVYLVTFKGENIRLSKKIIK